MQNAAAVMKMQQPDWSGNQWRGETIQVWQMWDAAWLRCPGLRCETESKGTGRRNGRERERGEERRSKRWNKCVRFERQWAEHALKEMPLPPSLLPSYPVRKIKYTQIETHFLCTVSIQWSRLSVNHTELQTVKEKTGKKKSSREHVATTQATCAYCALHHLQAPSSLKNQQLYSPHDCMKERRFLVTGDKSEGIRLASKQLLNVTAGLAKSWNSRFDTIHELQTSNQHCLQITFTWVS